MKIRKNDTVKVIAGKDKGRTGVVERVYVRQSKVLVADINMYKKHVKRSEQFPQGGIVEIPRPLDVAKVMLVHPATKKAVRVSYKVESGKKVRVAAKSHEPIAKK